MIAFVGRLPLLRIGPCERSDYDTGWLEEQIRTAARSAGHDRWWFAEDMARSIFIYLEERFPDKVITLQELSRKVERVLEELGFADIAGELAIEPPPWRVELHRVALRAGAGYELMFYSILEKEIRLGLDSGADSVSVTGLRPAVKILCGARRWHKGCERTGKEVARFVEGLLGGGKVRRFSLY